MKNIAYHKNEFQWAVLQGRKDLTTWMMKMGTYWHFFLLSQIFTFSLYIRNTDKVVEALKRTEDYTQ